MEPKKLTRNERLKAVAKYLEKEGFTPDSSHGYSSRFIAPTNNLPQNKPSYVGALSSQIRGGSVDYIEGCEVILDSFFDQVKMITYHCTLVFWGHFQAGPSMFGKDEVAYDLFSELEKFKKDWNAYKTQLVPRLNNLKKTSTPSFKKYLKLRSF